MTDARPMADRLHELEKIARAVEMRFHGLPNCPRGLTVVALAVGHIQVELNGRTFKLNPAAHATVLEATGWYESVLKVIFGVPRDPMGDLKRRALLIGALDEAEIMALSCACAPSGWPPRAIGWRETCAALERRGFVQRAWACPCQPAWAITEFGREALEAHR